MGVSNFSGKNPDDNNNNNNGGGGIGGISFGGAGGGSSQGLPGSNVDPKELLIDYNAKKQPKPALFRDEVIRHILGVLIAKDKPNPLMVGPAGVGKTRIVEEIARRIVEKDPVIPQELLQSTIYELPLSNIVAGSSFVGQVEEKIQGVLEFIKDPANKAILFIDEIHLLVGDNHTYGKIAQIMKPALSRGEIKCIGATTTQEIKGFMNDPALNRRFSRIIVDEFTKGQTIELLQSVKGEYMAHYKLKVHVDDDIIPEIVALADEYRPAGSHRPDNALTLLDRSMGDAIINHAQKVIDCENELHKAQADGDTVKEAALQSTLTAMKSILTYKLAGKEVRETAMNIMSGCMKQQTLDVEKMKEALSVIKGQDDICDAVILNLRRRELGIFPKKAPLSMLFAGNSGVGKTQITRIIAKELTGSDPITLNMTEFHSSASINRIIGSPAGYIGSESNAELPFDSLESNPYQFILLDEFEKADPAVQKLFMSVLEDGFMKTNRGSIIDFSRCVVIATTNAGHVDSSTGLGFNDGTKKDNARKETAQSLSRWFNLALLGRFTEIITFHKLEKDIYREIIAAKYHREVERIIDEKPRLKSQLVPNIPDAELDEIVKETYVPEFGARPAEKAARDYIEKQLL